MRKLIRSPLTWMVSAELVVVAFLVVFAWTVVANASRPVVVSPSIQLPGSPADDSSALPDFPGSSPAARGPAPGLNLNSSFWRSRLAELNRDQVVLAQLEWRLVHGAMDAMKRYVETVVLPAVRRAERAEANPYPSVERWPPAPERRLA
jgi:hypothetical protein